MSLYNVDESVDPDETIGGQYYEKALALLDQQAQVIPSILRNELYDTAHKVLEGAMHYKGFAKLVEETASSIGYDVLTGLFNRRTFNLIIEKEVAKVQRENSGINLAFLDVDRFKVINDTHGHQRGDEHMRAVAGILTANSRKGDALARYGGDELVLLMPEQKSPSPDEIMRRMERIREQVEKVALQDKQDNLIGTVSIGIAGWQSGMTSDDLIGAADRAVYAAKEHRNTVIFSD